jgi:predicted alpha/beta hydrolase
MKRDGIERRSKRPGIALWDELMAKHPQLGQSLEIQAEGAQLSARFYSPQRAAKAYLLLHGAAGLPQRYYAAFANWASEQGLGVLTYDYRDFGESLHRPLHQSGANFADRMIRDLAAAEARLAALAPEGPLWLLGHSLGGLGFAFREHDPRVERVTTIGAGFCHVSDQPWSFRPIALAFFYVVGPVGTALAGYLSGRNVPPGADLPAGVYWQWRKWATRRDFFQSDVGKSCRNRISRSKGRPCKCSRRPMMW